MGKFKKLFEWIDDVTMRFKFRLLPEIFQLPKYKDSFDFDIEG